MGALWDEHYDGIRQLIDVNPTRITWQRHPLKENSRGEPVADMEAEPLELSAWARISHQSGGVRGAESAAGGITANFSTYVVALRGADLRQGDVITADAGAIRKWKVGVVDELAVDGEPYAMQAPLARADG